MPNLSIAPEYRASTRALTASGRSVSGYVCTWGVAYPIPDGYEVMARDSVDASDLELTAGHDLIDGEGRRLQGGDAPVLASVRAGTLIVTSDDVGLHISAPELDDTDPDVIGALAKLRRGDVRGLSVGMYVTKAEKKGASLREVQGATAFQAALVGRPANPTAEAELRAAQTASSAPALIPYTPSPYYGWAEDGSDTAACAGCQRLNDADARFCDQCGGGPLEPTTPYEADPDEVVVCPVCGLLNDTDARFCDQDGTKLIGRTDVLRIAADRSKVPAADLGAAVARARPERPDLRTAPAPAIPAVLARRLH